MPVAGGGLPRVDSLRREGSTVYLRQSHADAGAGLTQASLHHIPHPELTRDPLGISPLSLVAEGRVARDHREPAGLRQIGDQVLRNAVEKELRLGIAAQILKGQYRDRWSFRYHSRFFGFRPGLGRRRSVENNAERAHRARQVCHHVLAEIGKGERQLIANLVAHRAADVDAARFREAFQPRGHRDAVAVDGFVIADHIADIEAHPKPDLPVPHRLDEARCHRVLDIDGALHGVDDAVEFDEEAVAHASNGPPPVIGYLWIDDLAPHRVQSGKRALFIASH